MGAKALPEGRRKLLYVAKRRLNLSDEDFRALLLAYGGTESTGSLDERGFDAVMDRFRALGFVSDARRATLGNRPGMASPAQVQKIKALWGEVMENPTDRALDHFISNHFKVSALRFVDAKCASTIISVLVRMRDRRRFE